MADEKGPPGLEHALLGLLRERPMHAYEMHARLEQAESLGLVWRLKQGHLYALLGRLEEAGYVASITQLQIGRPPRKVLHLTDAGRWAFDAWLAAPVAHGRDFRMEFLAKLYFAAQEGPSAVAALVGRQRAECALWLAGQRARLDETPADQPYERLVHRFRLGQIEAILGWLDACAASFADPGRRPTRTLTPNPGDPPDLGAN
jgi:DNA-binding PadR family transcriptional regulator